MDKKKPTLHKKINFYDIVLMYKDLLFIIGCAGLTLIIILLFVGACAHFNVSFTETGMLRNFLIGGV